MAIVFAVSLGDEEWDDDLGGWRCAALSIPSARIDSVYERGAKIDASWYEALYHHRVLRWIREARPTRITVSIILTEELSTEAETARWKRLAILLPAIATVLSALVTSVAPTLVASAAPKHAALTRNIAVNPVGVWVGKWDNTYGVRVTVTQNQDSGSLSILYEWEEAPGQPFSSSHYLGHMEKNVLEIEESGIELLLSEQDGGTATARGKFKTPRTAILTRQ